jgi:hypothetical protein
MSNGFVVAVTTDVVSTGIFNAGKKAGRSRISIRKTLFLR